MKEGQFAELKITVALGLAREDVRTVGLVGTLQEIDPWPLALNHQNLARDDDPVSLGLRLRFHFSPSIPDARGAVG